MPRTLYILTRHRGARGDSQLDEFVREWYFRHSVDEVVLDSGNRRIIFIHGFDQRFPEQKDHAILLRRMREVVIAYPSNGGEKGFLCHPWDPNLVVKPAFDGFTFAGVYSVGASKSGEWALLQKLTRTYTHQGAIREVTDAPAFESTFDAIWDHYNPDKTLREDIEERHKAFVEVARAAPEPVPLTNQTRYYLLIWNELSGKWISQMLFQYLTSLNNNPVQITLVASRNDFDLIDWSQKWRKVFVLAELYWTKIDFEGIPLVLEVLGKRGEDVPLEILTCSVFDRTTLYDAVRDINQLVLKSFPHLKLPSSASDSPNFSVIEQMHVSARKWRYKCAELLDEREILGSLLHQLKYLQQDTPDLLQKAAQFYTNLSNLRSLLNANTLEAAIELKTLIDSGESSVAIVHLHLQKLQSSMQSLLDERAVVIDPVCRQARLMIVEDDPIIRNKIRELFAPWFSETIVFETGYLALAELKKDGIRFTALIVDLELLDDDGFEDLVQGVDLVDYCERFWKHIAIRVVTGLPRNSIPKRLSDFKNDRIVLKQGIINNENESYFILPHFDEQEFMERLFQEIKELKRLHKDRNYPGPSNGKFSPPTAGKDSPNLTAVYYELKVTLGEEFEAKIKDIGERARRLLLNPAENRLNTKFARPANNLRSTWEFFLWDLLALRLAAISLQKKDGAVIHIDYGDDTGFYFDLGFKKTTDQTEAQISALRGWFTTRLGFSFKPEFEDEKVKIHLNDSVDELFPHENEWKRNMNLADLVTLVDKFSKSFCTSLQVQMSKILELQNTGFDENTMASIRQFGGKTSFPIFKQIMLSLMEHKENKLVDTAYQELLHIIRDEYDNATDVIEMPGWLERLIDK